MTQHSSWRSLTQSKYKNGMQILELDGYPREIFCPCRDILIWYDIDKHLVPRYSMNALVSPTVTAGEKQHHPTWNYRDRACQELQGVRRFQVITSDDDKYEILYEIVPMDSAVILIGIGGKLPSNCEICQFCSVQVSTILGAFKKVWRAMNNNTKSLKTKKWDLILEKASNFNNDPIKYCKLYSALLCFAKWLRLKNYLVYFHNKIWWLEFFIQCAA